LFDSEGLEAHLKKLCQVDYSIQKASRFQALLNILFQHCTLQKQPVEVLLFRIIDKQKRAIELKEFKFYG